MSVFCIRILFSKLLIANKRLRLIIINSNQENLLLLVIWKLLRFSGATGEKSTRPRRCKSGVYTVQNDVSISLLNATVRAFTNGFTVISSMLTEYIHLYTLRIYIQCFYTLFYFCHLYRWKKQIWISLWTRWGRIQVNRYKWKYKFDCKYMWLFSFCCSHNKFFALLLT